MDDTPTNSKILQDALIANGFNVLIANSGEEGLQIIDKEKFTENDTILVDSNMPRMSGLDFIERVKRSGGKSDMKLYSKMKLPPEMEILAIRRGASGIAEFKDVVNSLLGRIDNLINKTEERLSKEI